MRSLDLPLMILADLLWPMYGLMLVQPFMEFSGSMIALSMYRKHVPANTVVSGNPAKVIRQLSKEES